MLRSFLWPQEPIVDGLAVLRHIGGHGCRSRHARQVAWSLVRPSSTRQSLSITNPARTGRPVTSTSSMRASSSSEVCPSNDQSRQSSARS
ncbi:hypothetical protein SHJG_1631 [Streptomyces hygroscopicus subsp. jinggangensis 5008]|nr:hypothetical protein SHJG_1631 [Streptomyces hygroscopicus subsp. jinggangensis 5008]